MESRTQRLASTFKLTPAIAVFLPTLSLSLSLSPLPHLQEQARLGRVRSREGPVCKEDAPNPLSV